MDQRVTQIIPPAAANLKKHQLPALPYDYAALQPAIDARTMTLHHDIHHAGYVEKLNAALDAHPDLRNFSASWLLSNLVKVPEDIRVAVRNNAGGHVNHSLFWRAMRPQINGKPGEPTGPLRDAIDRDFGSFAACKTRFEEAGAKHFASGWVWLARRRQPDARLEVVTTAGHEHPSTQDQFGILLNDVWEHAYYLHYESRRADYLKAWWAVTDWDEAARRFELSDTSSQQQWEAEGGHLLTPQTTTPKG